MLLLLACAPDPSPAEGATALPLRWVRGWEGDDWARARSGLWWQLVTLGARPPKDDAGLVVVSSDEDRVLFTLDLAEAGFPDEALAAMVEAAGAVAGSDEVALTGGLDLGAFFLATLYEPWHYYRVTGACSHRDDWAAAHLVAQPLEYAITISWLTEGDRLDRYNPGTSDIAHHVEEGDGLIAEGSFEPFESESIDVMPNGMLRYAVYDGDGGLLPWSSRSPAGQPGKCMWCHEAQIQRGDVANAAEGYVTAADFIEEITAQNAALALRRLGPVVGSDPATEHEDGELLTETWLHAPVGRLAREWAVEEAVVRDALDAAGVATTTNDEYPAHGDVVARADAELAFALLLPEIAADPEHPFFGWEGAYSPIPTLPTAREPADAPLAWGEAEELRCE